MTNFELNSSRARQGIGVSGGPTFGTASGHATPQPAATHITIPLRRDIAGAQNPLTNGSWTRKVLGACSIAMFLVLALAVVPGLFGWGALPVGETSSVAGTGALALVRDSGFSSTQVGNLIAYQTADGIAVAKVSSVNASGLPEVSGTAGATPITVSEYEWLGGVSTVWPGVGWIGQALLSPALLWGLTVGQIVIVLALMGVRRSERVAPRASAVA